MKKYLFIVLICLTSVGVMAQHHHQDNHHHDHYTEQHHDSHHHDQHHGEHHPAPAPVQYATVEQVNFAVQMVEKQSYDDKRMEVAKLCVVLCPFTVRDLARMANCFTMEDNKVKFLIFAHHYCPDRENYYMFRDVLRYRSDYDRLMNTVEPGKRL